MDDYERDLPFFKRLFLSFSFFFYYNSFNIKCNKRGINNIVALLCYILYNDPNAKSKLTLHVLFVIFTIIVIRYTISSNCPYCDQCGFADYECGVIKYDELYNLFIFCDKYNIFYENPVIDSYSTDGSSFFFSYTDPVTKSRHNRIKSEITKNACFLKMYKKFFNKVE